MEMSKTTVGALVGLCLAVGAGGAFLTTRGGDTSPAIVASEPGLVDPQPVQEVVVDPPGAVEPSAPAPWPVAASAPRVSPRVESASPGAAPAALRTDETPADRPVLSAREAIDVNASPALGPVRPDEPGALRTPEPPAPQFEELVVSTGSVIGLQLESTLTSETARVEDTVVARVTRDVRVGDRVAIPVGARARGEVTLVERGGRLRNQARLGVRFTSVTLADGTRVPIETETIYREGDSPGGESASKIGGGAIGGAIIGGILGGAKGAILGGTAGAGAGSAVVLAGGRNPATLAAGTPVTVRVLQPATVIVGQ